MPVRSLFPSLPCGKGRHRPTIFRGKLVSTIDIPRAIPPCPCQNFPNPTAVTPTPVISSVVAMPSMRSGPEMGWALLGATAFLALVFKLADMAHQEARAEREGASPAPPWPAGDSGAAHAPVRRAHHVSHVQLKTERGHLVARAAEDGLGQR